MALASSNERPEELLQAALNLHRAGRLGDAEALYEQLLRLQRNNADGLHLLGVCRHAQGDFAAAERHIRGALKIRPTMAAAHLSYGNALRELGRLAEAAQSYARAAGLDPTLALAHYNLGTAYEEAGRHGDALASYERAMALGPHAPAAAGRANCLAVQGRAVEAIAAYEAALAIDPEPADVRVNLAVALSMAGRVEDAVAQVRAVLARHGDHPAANRTLAALLSAQGRPGDALAAVEQARAAAPDDPELLLLHARALSGQRRLPEAAALLRQLVQRQPEHVGGLNELAAHLAALGQTDEAARICDAALARNPQDLHLQFTRGYIAHRQGEYGRARGMYEAVLARSPEMPSGAFQLGMLDLLQGDFAAGLPRFEQRWNDARGWLPAPRYSQPPWRGETDLAGSRLLVHCEQGLGDTLQFVRYVPLLARRGVRVVLEVQPPVLELVRRAMPAEVTVVARGGALPPFDRVCPLLSLPLACATTLESIPAAPAYLAADPARVRIWQARLGAPRGLRVGIAWSGNPRHHDDLQRSISLARLRELMQGSPGVEFIAVQNDIADADRDHLAELPQLTYLGEAIADLDDSAALLAGCDLTISVDTSAAHLAGATGRPVWILLPFVPDWRWMLEREDSPWYPTARLFRQGRRDDWSAVLERVRHELAAFVRRAGPAGAAAGRVGTFVGSGPDGAADRDGRQGSGERRNASF